MAIAHMRRELMRHAKAKLLFLDETFVRIGTCQTHTLVAPGEQSYEWWKTRTPMRLDTT